MATKKTKYSRDFAGTNTNPLDPHSSFELNPEDKKIRKTIIDKFSGNLTCTKSGKEIHYGFDGSQQYFFSFYEENWNKEEKNKPAYTSTIEIYKTGNFQAIKNFNCDLENFLENKKDDFKFKRKD